MRVSSLSNEARGEFSSTWILLTDSPDFFSQPELVRRAKPPSLKRGLHVWTDDYSSLLSLLRW